MLILAETSQTTEIWKNQRNWELNVLRVCRFEDKKDMPETEKKPQPSPTSQEKPNPPQTQHITKQTNKLKKPNQHPRISVLQNKLVLFLIFL